MTEERTLATDKGKNAKAKGGGASKGEAGDEGEEGGKKKKLPIIIGAAVLVIALAVGGFFMFMKPSDANAVEEEPEPIPGEVLVLEPISVNLAENHYLRLGMSLQLIEGAGGGHGPIDGSHAMDIAISTFTGEEIEHLQDEKHREELREELLHEIEEAYHHEVMAVYFTEFVTQ